MTIQKIRHKELNETFFKTVFYDDDAQNSGQARGKSLTKSKTESLNKMHSHLIQAYIQGLLSHHSWRKLWRHNKYDVIKVGQHLDLHHVQPYQQ